MSIDDDEVRVHLIREIDRTDHVYTVLNKPAKAFFEKLSAISKTPILNQTSISGKFCFMFRYGENDSAMDVLDRMGFQTKISARKRLVIHVSENGSSTKTQDDSSNGN